jgi:hypothetical protein
MWKQGVAVHGEARPEFGADEINKRREDVECGHVGADAVWGKCGRVVDEKWDSDGWLEIRHLVPQTTLTQHVTMIATENDYGVVIQTAVLEGLQQLANAVINVRDRTIVGPTSTLDLIRSEFFVPEIADFQEPLGVRVLLFLGDDDFGKLNLNILIQVPVLLLNRVWVMWVSERDSQGERSSFSWELADMIIEELLGSNNVSTEFTSARIRLTCT